MPAAIDKGTLDRLIAQGRARGGLTVQDLQAALQIDAMSTEDLALVVARLEDAGVPVDLDENLLQPHAGARSAPEPGADILASPDHPDSPRPRPVREAPLQTVARTQEMSEPRAPGRHRFRPVHWAVAFAGVLILVLALILLALRAPALP